MTILGDSPEQVTPDRGGLDPQHVEWVQERSVYAGAPMTYEVCTRDGYIYAVGRAEYVGLIAAIDADRTLRRELQNTPSGARRYLVLSAATPPAPLFVAPAPLYQPRGRNPLTGHYTGGDRGAR